MRQKVGLYIVKRKRRLKLCILIDKNHVTSIHTGSVSVAVSGKGQPEPLQTGLCHQGKCVWDSAFVPCSNLLSTNAMTVISVMINASTVVPAHLWPCRWVDFGSSFLETLITWQTEEPEEESEWYCSAWLPIPREVSNRDKILSCLDMPVFLQWLYRDSLNQLLWKQIESEKINPATDKMLIFFLLRWQFPFCSEVCFRTGGGFENTPHLV